MALSSTRTYFVIFHALSPCIRILFLHSITASWFFLHISFPSQYMCERWSVFVGVRLWVRSLNKTSLDLKVMLKYYTSTTTSIIMEETLFIGQLIISFQNDRIVVSRTITGMQMVSSMSCLVRPVYYEPRKQGSKKFMVSAQCCSKPFTVHWYHQQVNKAAYPLFSTY